MLVSDMNFSLFFRRPYAVPGHELRIDVAGAVAVSAL